MKSLEETIAALSAKLLALDPGPLAQLRRMESDSAGTSMFWRLVSTLGLPVNQTKEWMKIVCILAILTPKPSQNASVRLHDRMCRLGYALCDGGNPAWPSDPQNPRPALSEQRLARLLATPASQCGEVIERIARMLARSRTPEVGINCTEIALLLLTPDDPLSIQNIARYYYARLDRADRDSNKATITMEGTAA
jgi:CRISPR system Cascade subunit CasB